MTEYRAVFDAEVSFVNGGGLSAQGFRLDVPRADVSEGEVAELLVRHLGLALVGGVEFAGFEVVEEAHKGSRGVDRHQDVSKPTDASGRGPLVDLSHTIRAGLVTYPGIPAPTIRPHLTREASRKTYAPGTEFEIDVIDLPGNTGTYLDSPFHRYEDGGDLSTLPLETLVGLRAEVFHLQDASERGIPAAVFFERPREALAGAAVLLHTGWSRRFGTPAYATGSPFLTEEGTRFLVDAGVALVGIDALNIDDTESGGTRPAHTLLLEAGIHVVEHLTALDRLPARGARFTAVPPRVEGFGTFPVRAFAELPAGE
ncbi:cyclase family protein [Agromyces protaetiae]|uniref:Cyclase family protein n=1 Tax=Agromyces protaetiae TaxID=2509455 RepID=A0A4P6FEI2_9MICO|nr:cyclase family protein [Agromyces protaetiae]QAY72097.1 cyclase family protein [Agromyces protaetiae]